MNVIDAMIYCLGFISETPEDGEYRSQTVYDKNGDPHWFAWDIDYGKDARPLLCSESSRGSPFVASLEPYRLFKECKGDQTVDIS